MYVSGVAIDMTFSCAFCC